MEFVKSHGLGNDYLVCCSGEPMTPQWAIDICNRHTGLGGDGVLEPFETNKADYGVRIWNPDGSLAEKSGNGLRIFARWLVDAHSVRHRLGVLNISEFSVPRADSAWYVFGTWAVVK